MKKILLVIVLILCEASYGQKKSDMAYTCIGSMEALNELFETNPITKIAVQNLDDNTYFKQDVIVLNDHKTSFYTIMIIRLTPNLAYSFGYAPGVTGETFNDTGEICVYKRERGNVIKVAEFTQYAHKFSENNEKYESFSNEDIQIIVKGKFEVQTIFLKSFNRKYFLPKDYFEYK